MYLYWRQSPILREKIFLQCNVVIWDLFVVGVRFAMDKIFQIDSLHNFQIVSEEFLSNLYYLQSKSTSAQLEVDVIEAAKQDFITIISECNFDTERIAESFYNKGWQQEKVKCFLNLLERNKTEIFNAALNHHNSCYCETVINFDWSLKYVLGTSELKTIKYPLVQLVLATLNSNGFLSKTMFDADKDMLLKLINILEKNK